jgi:hypothetical protein
MKANARLILLLLSIIFSVLAFVFIYSSSSDYHSKKTAIDAAFKEGEEFILSAKKEKVDVSSKLAFESRRNEELGSDLEALRLDLEKEQKEFASIIQPFARSFPFLKPRLFLLFLQHSRLLIL